MPDGFAQHLDADTVRVPDVAFFRKANEGKIKPTHSEGGADLVIEIVSRDSCLRDQGEKFYLMSGWASRSTGSWTPSEGAPSSFACARARTIPSCPMGRGSSTPPRCPASYHASSGCRTGPSSERRAGSWSCSRRSRQPRRCLQTLTAKRSPPQGMGLFGDTA